MHRAGLPLDAEIAVRLEVPRRQGVKTDQHAAFEVRDRLVAGLFCHRDGTGSQRADRGDLPFGNAIVR